MTKKQIVDKYFNQRGKLKMTNQKYKHQVKWFCDFMLTEDLGDIGDITSDTVLKNNPKAVAIITAKESGIIAGLEEILWLCTKYKIHITKYKQDGASVKKGEKILKLTGNIKTILKLERTVLNILQRMSGIATQTNKLITKSGPLLCPTRKTQWGLLDKKAVVLGGGGTHRLGLYDWILIKDNHISVMLSEAERSGAKSKHPLLQSDEEGDPSARLRLAQDDVFYEIECKTEKQAINFAKQNPGAIMLDNMTPKQITKILNDIKILGYAKDIIFEASGGINAKNIREYQKTGVDIISLGSLTHSAKVLDLSLNIL